MYKKCHSNQNEMTRGIPKTVVAWYRVVFSELFGMWRNGCAAVHTVRGLRVLIPSADSKTDPTLLPMHLVVDGAARKLPHSGMSSTP